MDITNTAIVDFQSRVAEKIEESQIKNDLIRDKIVELNANLNDGVDDLIFQNIDLSAMSNLTVNTDSSFGTLSDKILKSGKDLLLMADQANQFICVSNITFSRVVDVFLALNSNIFENNIVEQIENIVEKQQLLFDYLGTRETSNDNNGANETQNGINSRTITINNARISTESMFTGFNGLLADSVEVLETFQDILAVNVTVGIALSVTEPAWQELKIMSMLNYRTTSNDQGTVEETSDSNTLTGNDLFPEIPPSTLENILTYLPRVFLEDSEIRVGAKKFKVINDADISTIHKPLDDSFSPLSVEDIQNQAKTRPDLLRSLFGDIAFAEHVDISDNTLITYYQNILNPAITQEEFVALFHSAHFLQIKQKYTSSECVDEFIAQHRKYIQFLLLRDAVKGPAVNSAAFEFNDEMVEGEILFNNIEEDSQFNSYMINYLKTKRRDYSVTQEYFDRIDDQMDAFHTENHVTDLVHQTKSGEITILEYVVSGSVEKLVKNIAKFRYSYSIYSDKLQMYYAEVRFKDFAFLIKNNKIILSYRLMTEDALEVTYIEKRDRHIVAEYNLSGYLIANNHNPFTTAILKIAEETKEVIESKMDGDKTVNQIQLHSTGSDGNFTITKNTGTVVTNTTFVSNNRIERTTTNITNIYRDELLAGNMDFAQARVNSIISSLRFLKYRDKLEDFIDKTWDMNIPRPVRG